MSCRPCRVDRISERHAEWEQGVEIARMQARREAATIYAHQLRVASRLAEEAVKDALALHPPRQATDWYEAHTARRHYIEGAVAERFGYGAGDGW